jgi:hypothetical protein
MDVDVEAEDERRTRKRDEARERVMVQQRKLREVMRGKTIVRNKVTGEIRVLDKPEENMEEEEELNYDELVGDDENHIDLMIEVEESMQNDKIWNTFGSTGSLDGHSYLDDLAEVEREDDRKRESVKKRKKVEEEEVEIKIKGLKVSPGWVERTKEALEDEKWQRIVIDKTGRGDGAGKERREGMTIPDSHDVGLDRRGSILNSSNRRAHNFGSNKMPLFARKDGGKGEGRNWTASFTRAGCVACRNEMGILNHRGRGGEPIVMVIGDGSVPSVVGYTIEGKEECCSWVIKKELLSLDEVPVILRKLNQEKKEWDRMNKRKEHEYFLQEGSKVIVVSYAQLRRDGIEGYIQEFNNMLRECNREIVEYGIEILPAVPTIGAGIDELGRIMIAGIQDWIEWIADTTGRREIKELAKSGGMDKKQNQEGWIQYKPSFVKTEVRKDERSRVGKRTLEMIRGERREIKVSVPTEPEEIGRIMENRRKVGDILEEERQSRKSSENGVSIEGEYTFSMAISRYSKVATEEGRYKGSVVKNITEQLRMRARYEGNGNGNDRSLRDWKDSRRDRENGRTGGDARTYCEDKRGMDRR